MSATIVADATTPEARSAAEVEPPPAKRPREQATPPLWPVELALTATTVAAVATFLPLFEGLDWLGPLVLAALAAHALAATTRRARLP